MAWLVVDLSCLCCCLYAYTGILLGVTRRHISKNQITDEKIETFFNDLPWYDKLAYLLTTQGEPQNALKRFRSKNHTFFAPDIVISGAIVMVMSAILVWGLSYYVTEADWLKIGVKLLILTLNAALLFHADTTARKILH